MKFYIGLPNIWVGLQACRREKSNGFSWKVCQELLFPKYIVFGRKCCHPACEISSSGQKEWFVSQRHLKGKWESICIINCSGFYWTANKMASCAQIGSSYKNNNTCNYWIGISPAWAVMFLSHGLGGMVSNKHNNGVWIFKELLWAAALWPTEDDFDRRGAVFRIPCFTEGKNERSAKKGGWGIAIGPR